MSKYIRTTEYMGLCPELATTRDRVYGAVLGEAIGDAIGHPIEDKWAADSTKKVEGLLKENQFTDDTQMFCAIGEALLDAPPHLGEEEFMKVLSNKFVEWRKAPLGGNHRAPGGNCMESVRKLGTGKSWRETGGTSFKGNGTAMRSGVVGCMYWKSPKFAFRIGCLTAVPTHNNLEAILAAGVVAFLVATPVVLPTMVERKEGGRWELITFDLIREGDMFRFLDPLDIGVATWIATEDAVWWPE